MERNNSKMSNAVKIGGTNSNGEQCDTTPCTMENHDIAFTAIEGNGEDEQFEI